MLSNMKQINIDEQLYERLVKYTKQECLDLEHYIHCCISQTITADEIQSDKKYQSLMKKMSSFIKKGHDDPNVFESNEYQEYLLEIDNYYNSKWA